MIPDLNEVASDLDASTHRVDVNGVSVNTAMVVRQVLGHGSPMSNDRLRRVRGMGKAPLKKPSGLSAIEEEDEEDPDFPEYDSMTMIGDPVAIIVKCQCCDTLAFAYIETIAIDGKIEGSVSSMELQKTTTKVTVRLATVDLKSPFYVITGVKAGHDSVVTISVSDMSPLSYTKVDKAGLYFSCEAVAELVLKPAPQLSFPAPPRWSPCLRASSSRVQRASASTQRQRRLSVACVVIVAPFLACSATSAPTMEGTSSTATLAPLRRSSADTAAWRSRATDARS